MRDRLADMFAAASMHRQIDMNVIVVKRIGARREHGRKMLAGTAVNIHQESAGLKIAARPVAHDRNLASVRQHEAADVQRVAKGMLRQRRVALIVHAATGVGTH